MYELLYMFYEPTNPPFSELKCIETIRLARTTHNLDSIFFIYISFFVGLSLH